VSNPFPQIGLPSRRQFPSAGRVYVAGAAGPSRSLGVLLRSVPSGRKKSEDEHQGKKKEGNPAAHGGAPPILAGYFARSRSDVPKRSQR